MCGGWQPGGQIDLKCIADRRLEAVEAIDEVLVDAPYEVGNLEPVARARMARRWLIVRDV